MKIYVASSWRNTLQPAVVTILRGAGHEVYDFRHPPGGDHLGFSWSEISPHWESWSLGAYLRALDHPIARAGFESDFGAMQEADACVLVLPSGRSAHLEAGYFAGAGKPLWIIAYPEEWGGGVSEIELMYCMADRVVTSQGELLEVVAAWQPPPACRVCGCTDDRACVGIACDEGCYWVEGDLCSSCAAAA